MGTSHEVRSLRSLVCGLSNPTDQLTAVWNAVIVNSVRALVRPLALLIYWPSGRISGNTTAGLTDGCFEIAHPTVFTCSQLLFNPDTRWRFWG